MIKQIESYVGLDVTMQVTEDCNLRCKYCYEVNKRPGNLPFEYAQRFIDLLLEDADPINIMDSPLDWILKSGLILDFIGGDALMVPELCDKILSYFQYRAYELKHRWKNRWKCSISTNGTLLGSPNVRKFLNKYKGNISLGISVDGCPEIHDKNRITRDGSGSMSAILKNWDFYMNYMGVERASTKSTLNKESIPYISDSIKYLHGILGLKHINMNFIFEDMGLCENDYKEIEEQFAKSIDYIYEHRNDLHVNMFSENFGIGEPYSKNRENLGWCGSGSMPCLAVNGKIYPCFRFVPNTLFDDSRDMSVGDVWNGFNRKSSFEKVRSFTRKNLSEDRCKSCGIESTCSWCIGGTYAETGKFYRNTNLCRIRYLIDKYSKKYWNRYYGWEKYSEGEQWGCSL